MAQARERERERATYGIGIGEVVEVVAFVHLGRVRTIVVLPHLIVLVLCIVYDGMELVHRFIVSIAIEMDMRIIETSR